jgi:hypothetical protein
MAQPDVCVDAMALTVPSATAGSTKHATFDNVGFCGAKNLSPGVWYTVMGNGNVFTATTCGAGTNYDTKLGVFSGACGALSCVAGNDDDPACDLSGLRSTVRWPTQPGTVYHILVHGFAATTDDFELALSEELITVNDDVCSAKSLTVGVATRFDTTFVTAQAGEVSPGAGTAGFTCQSQDGWCAHETGVQNSLWYTLVAPSSCVSIAAGPGNAQLAVYDVGDCDDFSTFTARAANDNSGPDFAAFIDTLTGLTPGHIYYIQLDGFAGAQIAGTILVTSCDVDGDSVLNDQDKCPNSDRSGTVVIDGCDTGVPNTPLPSGCTISDLVEGCIAEANDNAQFVSCVEGVTYNLETPGTLTDQQQGAIHSCAVQVDIPEDSP